MCVHAVRHYDHWAEAAGAMRKTKLVDDPAGTFRVCAVPLPAAGGASLSVAGLAFPVLQNSNSDQVMHDIKHAVAKALMK